MAEAGIDILEQTSKHVDELFGLDFDYVVTLCDNAKEQCIVFHSKPEMIHKAFGDPTLVMGDEEKAMAAFHIKAFIETMPEGLEKPA